MRGSRISIPVLVWELSLLLGAGLVGSCPAHAAGFVGIYADEVRDVSCVSTDRFTQFVRAEVPSPGLIYLTLRLEFPSNVIAVSRPRFASNVTDVIITSYNDGSVEWNVFFEDCPSGWVPVFDQDLLWTGGEPTELAIRREASLTRDCGFTLSTLEEVSALQLRPEGCDAVPAAQSTWSALRARYE